jgi:hypothetical protein
MKSNFRFIAIAVSVIVTLLILSSCMTAKKREDKAYRFFRENNDKLAKLCASAFPFKDSVVFGKLVVTHDTMKVAGVSLPCPTLPGQKIRYIKCPDQKTIYTEKTRIDTVYRENTARVSELNSKLSAERDLRIKSETDRDAQNKKYKNWLAIAIVEAALLAIAVFLYFRK